MTLPVISNIFFLLFIYKNGTSFLHDLSGQAYCSYKSLKNQF